MTPVAALCVRRDSPYWRMTGVDCFDLARDCRTFAGGMPVVAHPPCRAWGRLRTFARPRPGEEEVALFCLDAVRRCGGVLEHPEASQLLRYLVGCWRGRADAWGGRVVVVDQVDFGHRARKRTWLYVVRRDPGSIPVMQAVPTHVVGSTHRTRLWRREAGLPPVLELDTPERERTPLPFASWLVDLARGAA